MTELNAFLTVMPQLYGKLYQPISKICEVVNVRKILYYHEKKNFISPSKLAAFGNSAPVSRCKAPFVSVEIELFIFPSLLPVLQVFVLVDGNFVIASTLPILRQCVALCDWFRQGLF